jgi:STE24 endopeptidase
LFDTLIEQLERIEIEAVLAHEIGHYRKGHITKMILTSFLTTFIMFALMGYIANSDWFYTQFGFEKSEGFGSVLLMYSLYAGPFMFWFAPITNFFSRKHEYEADAFASELCNGGECLISALKKLHKKNLGNLTPHPLYSAFHYSHPTLAERMNALEKLSPSKNEE